MRQPFVLFRRKLRTGKYMYYYYVREGGKKVPRSTGCRTKAAAMEVVLRRRDEGTLVSEGRSLHLISFMKNMYSEGSEYMKDRRRIGGELRESTLIMYQTAIKRLEPYLGKLRLTEITQRHLEQIQEKMNEDGFSPRTINSSLACVGAAYKWAIRLGLTRTNPCELLPQMKMKTRAKVWTEKEAARLTTLKFWNGQIIPYLASLLCAYTGMRIGEVLALQWSDIRGDRIHVQHSIAQATKEMTETKNSRDRYVPLPPFVLEELVRYRTSPLWVLSKDGEHPVVYRSLAYTMSLYREKFGPDCRKTWHSFRHFLNTEVASGGVPETMVRAAIGHSSKEMTDHYYHGETADFSPFEQVQDKIEKTLANSRPGSNKKQKEVKH